MKSIPLTKGKFALVDDEDLEKVSSFHWHYDTYTGYARASIKGRWVFLHRFIMGAEKGEIIDHVNGNKLNCLRINLRFCTQSQNISNKDTPKSNTSGYRGVSWNKEKRKFDAQIKVNQKHKHLGRFNDPKDAAKAYNEAAIKYFGEFARLNEV